MYQSIKKKSLKKHIISLARPDTKLGSVRTLVPTVAAILAIISISIIVLSCLNLITYNRISNPKFIKEVVDVILLPFSIFNDNENYIRNKINDKYIESMETNKEDRSVPSYITRGALRRPGLTRPSGECFRTGREYGNKLQSGPR
jgi:hypothetical protein